MLFVQIASNGFGALEPELLVERGRAGIVSVAFDLEMHAAAVGMQPLNQRVQARRRPRRKLRISKAELILIFREDDLEQELPVRCFQGTDARDRSRCGVLGITSRVTGRRGRLERRHGGLIDLAETSRVPTTPRSDVVDRPLDGGDPIPDFGDSRFDTLGHEALGRAGCGRTDPENDNQKYVQRVSQCGAVHPVLPLVIQTKSFQGMCHRLIPRVITGEPVHAGVLLAYSSGPGVDGNSSAACRIDRRRTFFPAPNMRSRRHTCTRAGLLVGLVAIGAVEAQAGQTGIAGARESYNDGRIDDAIAAADADWRETGANAAAVVLARAKLERFRALEQASDLDQARDLLGAINPSDLSQTERVEWEIGIGASLYLQGLYGPAAEVLDRVLKEPLLTVRDRDRLLDWWASAVDRVAQQQQRDARTGTYTRLTRRLESELGRYPASDASTYWLVASARGAGEIERAWNLAVAGWVRAGRGHEALRSDLDRLVLQGVIPDLAASRAGHAPDEDRTIWIMAGLAGEWETLKSAWDAEP